MPIVIQGNRGWVRCDHCGNKTVARSFDPKLGQNDRVSLLRQSVLNAHWNVPLTGMRPVYCVNCKDHRGQFPER